jgi:hypothetical protein
MFATPVRDYRARTKEALRHLGVVLSARMRRPLLDLDAAERDAVHRAVDAARLASPAKVG